MKIGFTATHSENKPEAAVYSVPAQTAPKKSVVQVCFAARNRTLAYYNDQFDLRPGDIVYVDGKLAGLRGQVTEVCITLKSDSPIFMIHNKKFVPKDLTGIDVVIFGHSHKYSEQEIDGQLWLNPGSCGKRRFDQEITFALLTVEGKTISVEKILIPHK